MCSSGCHGPEGLAALRIQPGEAARPGDGQGTKGRVHARGCMGRAAGHRPVRPAGNQQGGAATDNQSELTAAQDRDGNRAEIRIHCSHPQ
jgi:hypothetical protein